MILSFAVNGKTVTVEGPPLRRLLDVLREDLGLTGTKEGCGEGECGACAVLLDGHLVNSCLVPLFQVAGRSVETVEGVAPQGSPDALQRAFMDEGAVQCGFCTPGMVMASRALLRGNHFPHREEIRTALAGNLCRCTGYEPIFRAVEGAAAAGYEVPPPPPAPEFRVTCTEEGRIAFFPESLPEALEILRQHPDALPVAGATDILPDLARGVRPGPHRVMDLTRLEELRGIREEDGVLVLGAGETFASLGRSPLVRRLFPSLGECAASVGGVAVQNRATLGGNVMNASAAADSPPVLLALDARGVLVSGEGAREVPAKELWTAYRRTARRPDELLTAVKIPRPAPGTREAFFKLGPRRALVISRLTLACAARLEEGRWRGVRIAVGSVAPVPHRLEELETFLEGRVPEEGAVREARRLAEDLLRPRTSREYRRDVGGNLVGRFLSSWISPR